MNSNTDSLWSIRGLPLVFSYLAFPAVDMLLRAGGVETFGSWIRSWIDGAWILLLAIGSIAVLLKFPQRIGLPNIPPLGVLVAGTCAVISATSLLRTGISLYPYVMELKPVAYAAVAFVWALAFGLPKERAFLQAGSLLSGLIASELLIRSALAHSVVHPIGSGEVNYDACLIVLSLCLALADKTASEGQISWLFFGVLATFSRTGSITALALLLFSPRLATSLKALAWVPAGFAVFLSFQSRALELAVTQIDRYIMWATAFQLFAQHPLGMVFGYGLGSALPANMPAGLSDLWESQAEHLGISGIFAFQFHAMWLRLVMSWGSAVVLYAVVVLLRWAWQDRSPLARYLAIVTVAEGFTMGLFYLSNVSVPTYLLMAIAIKQLYARKHAAIAKPQFGYQLCPNS